MKIKHIKHQTDLNDAINEFKNLPQIGLDLEFDKNRFRYGFTLCLIQVIGDQAIYVIDPLENLHLVDFFRLLENPEQEIVVFEFGEDLRLLQSLNCHPKNIYDVSFASKILNHPQVSLATLTASELNIELSKTEQKSNWTLRPLSEEQIKYAADDVRYLFKLKDILSQKIADAGLQEWVAQENQLFESSVQPEQSIEDRLFLKHKDKKEFNEVEWFVLIELLKLRDDLALRYNKPAFQILDKDFLFELSKNENHISLFFQNARCYKALKSEAFKTQLYRHLTNAQKQALDQGLKTSNPALQRLSPSELAAFRHAKAKEEEAKEKVYKPIQNEIKKRFGEFTATFILSNKVMSELANGNWSKYCQYREELIRSIAHELNLKLEH